MKSKKPGSFSLNELFDVNKTIMLNFYFAQFFESLPGRAYIKDKNGIYLMGNTELANDCGFTLASDLIGKTDYDLPSKEQADILRKVDFQIMESGESLFLEEPGTRMDGSPAIYSTRKIPLRDANNNIKGIFGLSIDITKEKQIEIMKNTQEHFYWKSKEGVYIDCNNAVAQSAGFQSSQDIVGKSDYDIFPKEMAEILHDIDLRIMSSGIPEVLEEPGLRNNGTQGTFLTSKFPLHDTSGNVSSIMGFSTDITLQKQAEIAKSDFVSDMEHDLRTPFAGISGISNLLYEMETDPEKKALLELLVKSCNQWEATHQQIISALSAKERLVVKKEPFSIKQELTEIKEMFEATAYLKKLSLHVDVIPEQIDRIETDKTKFRLILSSLIGNAINFTDEGSVNIITSYQNGIYEIAISDTGIGIPADRLDYIFEEFTKLSRSNKHKTFKGVGLGLYVSRKMAKELGGSIGVESTVGKGSIFTFKLPL